MPHHCHATLMNSLILSSTKRTYITHARLLWDDRRPKE
jgi:hypothetical protein